MPNVKEASLYYKDGSSDKEYHCQVVQAGAGYVVNFQFGRRGSTLQSGTKTPAAVDLAKATKVFESLVREKTAKGYSPGAAGTPYVATASEDRVTGYAPQLLNPIDDAELEQCLCDHSVGAQEKFDGKRLILIVKDGKAKASNRKGLEVGLPDPIAKAALAPGYDLVADGEAVGDVFHAFDLLEVNGYKRDLSAYMTRYKELSGIRFGPAVKVAELVTGEKEKRAFLARLRAEHKEGIVFKRLDAQYKPGRPSSGGSQLKYKFYATCSCVVGKSARAGKRSVALEMADGTPVGNVTIPPSVPVPAEGKVVEVRYLYAYKGGSLYQPVYLGERDDVGADKVDSLKLKAGEEE
jgi:bifunctional non-homologous end joining protein LigD